MILSIYVKFYLIFLLSFFLIQIIGHPFLVLCGINFKNNKYYNDFFRAIFGITIFSTFYALLKTETRTVLAISILPIIFLILENKQNKADNYLNLKTAFLNFFEIFEKKKILFHLIMSFVIFLSFFFATIKNSNFPYIIMPNDISFYSRVSYFLGLTGQENTFHIFNLLESDYNNPQPYHYIELWLNCGISNIFKELNILHYHLTTFPIFYLTAFYGLIGTVSSNIKGKAVINIFLAIAFMFVSSIVPQLYREMPLLSQLNYWILSGPIFNENMKLIIFYILYIAFFSLITNNYKIESIIIILLLPVFTIIAAPAVVGGILLFVILNYKTSFFNKSEIIRVLLYTIITMSSIAIFYLALDKGDIHPESAIYNNFRSLFFTSSILLEVKRKIMILFGVPLSIVVGYLPVLLVAVFSRKKIESLLKTNKNALFTTLLFMSIIFVGIIIWMILNRYINSSQLFYNPSIPAINCLIIFIFILLIKHNKKFIIAQLLVIVFISIYHFGDYTLETLNKIKRVEFSEEYLLGIKEFFHHKNKDIILGGSFMSTDDYNFSSYTKFTAIDVNGQRYLQYINDKAVTICLSDFEAIPSTRDEITKTREEEAFKVGIFYRFVQKQKKQNKFNSINESMREFIEKNHMEYFIFSKNYPIPKFITERRTKILVDSISGEKFLFYE